MLKSYKYRLRPNKEQISLIEQTIGCCRLVYNIALQVKIEAYKINKTNLSTFDLCYQLAEMKQDCEWLRKVDSQALQSSIRKVDISFRRFFKGNGYPKFKGKNGKQSFQCPNNTRKVDWINGLLTIPKIKNIPIILSRRFYGEIKTITIIKTITGKYFASILVDDKKELAVKKLVDANTAVGIDLGIKSFAVLSNGQTIHNPHFLKNNLKRLKCLHRRSSRKKKGSSNRKKANKKLAIRHEKIANMNRDFLHKFSNAITKQYDTICVENLNISGMVKNHKLSQAVNAASWATALKFIKYKSELAGKNYIQIGRFIASSKIHNKCGFKNDLLTLADREWYCPNCNQMVLRDENAAINIKQEGLKQYLLTTSVGSRKEPVELSLIEETMKQEVKDNLIC